MTTRSITTILGLSSALASAAPSQAHPTLLPSRALAPPFVLRDSNGGTLSLRSLLGRYRIVVAFVPDNAMGRAYLDTVRAQKSGYDERDLRVLIVTARGTNLSKTRSTARTRILIDASGRVRQVYGATVSGATFYLIGKDRHIALAQRGFLSNASLFGLIDAMPMRRREMRKRKS